MAAFELVKTLGTVDLRREKLSVYDANAYLGTFARVWLAVQETNVRS